MIKRLRVKNYKSLRDVELELGRLNALIGPSNSGKSNTLDCLAFLAETCQRPIHDAFFSRGEYLDVVFGGQEKDIELVVDCLLDSRDWQYSLRLGKQGISGERLAVAGEAKIERGESGSVILKDDGSWQDGSTNGHESTLYALDGNQDFSAARKFRDYLSSWRLYHFSTTAEMRSITDAKRVYDLEKSGRNLIQVLISLRNAYPGVFDQVEEALRQGVPEIENLLTPLTPEGRAYLAVREQGFEQEFDCCHLSDGTLKLLGCVTAAALPWPRLLCFEELENSIHLRLLQLVIDLLQKSEKQVIFSTHLPYITNFVQPEDIRIVEKKQGETKVRRVDQLYVLRDTLRIILS
jgi:predicted ATPase